MKYWVQVKPRSKVSKVEKMADGSLAVWVAAPPVEGKANEAVLEGLAKYFRVPKSAIIIKSGLSGKRKLIEITE
ncbi:MAG: DUF167 domain-containing protein [Deltaproteobacteria bacterium]|nr:DUF167 domain-containing protein [Deltaproteobacteria bacterium]